MEYIGEFLLSIQKQTIENSHIKSSHMYNIIKKKKNPATHIIIHEPCWKVNLCFRPNIIQLIPKKKKRKKKPTTKRH